MTENDRCIHWLAKATCSVCNKKALQAAQMERRADARSVARVESKMQYIHEFELDAFTVGFLAARAYLAFSLPAVQEENFRRDYKRLAGVNPEDDGEYSVFADQAQQWAVGCSVKFRLEPNDENYLDFGDLKLMPVDGHELRVDINNTKLGWALIALGFRLGKKGKHIAQIRENMGDHTEQFDAGVQYGLVLRHG
jgi:hypothetical protein